MKPNGTHQSLVYDDDDDDVNILGGSVGTVRKSTDAVVDASKEIRREGNDDKSKYMVMCRNQNAGRSHNIKIDNSSFEREEQFKYLGKNLKVPKFYSGRN